MTTIEILLIVLFSIAMIIVWGIIFILVVVAERKYKINKLKENISLFSPTPLRRRMQTYSKNLKENREISEIDIKIKIFEKRDFPLIKKDLQKILPLTEAPSFYKFILFNKQYKQILSSVQEYEKEFLYIRFSLFDLTSDIEIEKAIINKLKSNFQKVKESVANSPQEQIRESKKIEKKINSIKSLLVKLEKFVDTQIKHLSEEFILNVKKIENVISNLDNDIESMNYHIKHMEEDLRITFKKIVESSNNNKRALIEIDHIIKGLTKDINIIKNQMKEDLIDLKIKRVNENSVKLNLLVGELYVLIHSNIDYYKFNKENDNVINKLLLFTNEHDPLFTSEIKRYNVESEKDRLVNINTQFESFKSVVRKYEKENMSQLNKASPEGINKNLMDSIYAYERYILTVEENVEDISVVNSKTNDINKSIANMNTSLLQVEHNINLLPTAIRDRFNVRKEELQLTVSKLRDNFKENTKLPTNQIIEDIQILKREINSLVDETKGTAFEMYFLKEAIMMLNIYKGTNDKYDELVDSLYKSYYEEKITESLRKTKEIIEIYGIK